jgi:hypothetical protein
VKREAREGSIEMRDNHGANRQIAHYQLRVTYRKYVTNPRSSTNEPKLGRFSPKVLVTEPAHFQTAADSDGKFSLVAARVVAKYPDGRTFGMLLCGRNDCLKNWLSC